MLNEYIPLGLQHRVKISAVFAVMLFDCENSLIAAPVCGFGEGSCYVFEAARKLAERSGRKDTDPVRFKGSYRKASYGDVIRGSFQAAFIRPRKQHIEHIEATVELALMVMPMLYPVSLDTEIALMRSCVLKAVDMAVKEHRRTLRIIIHPFETSHLPLTVRYYLIKETVKEAVYDLDESCSLRNVELIMDTNALKQYTTVAHGGSYFKQSKVHEGMEDLKKMLDYSGGIEELLKQAEQQEDVPPDLKRFIEMTRRFPQTMNTPKENRIVRDKLLEERDSFMNSRLRQNAPADFALSVIKESIKQWAKARELPQNKIVSTLCELTYYGKSQLSELVKGKGSLPSRDYLIALAVAMNLNYEQRQRLVSCTEPSLIYPKDYRETVIEEYIAAGIKRNNPTIDKPLELYELNEELYMLGKQYGIYRSRREIENKFNAKLDKEIGRTKQLKKELKRKPSNR